MMNDVQTPTSNMSVSGGNLILTLASSTSGALVSTDPNGGAKPGFQFSYGVTEARVFFPGSSGTRCYNWPAWWTTGQSWPTTGENDIAEVLTGDMTVNYHSSSGAHNQGTVPGSWCGAFHTYGLNRQPNRSDVYFDGKLVKSYATDDKGAPHYLILNVGHDADYPMYGTAGQVKADYVRAWSAA
jgi:beta-glucanase (GH16 family)